MASPGSPAPRRLRGDLASASKAVAAYFAQSGVGGDPYLQTPRPREAQRPPVALIAKGDYRCPFSAINMA